MQLEKLLNKGGKYSLKSCFLRLRNFLSRFRRVLDWGRSVWLWVAILFITAYAFMGWVVFEHWCWFAGHESDSAILRNLALTVAAALGLPFVLWRSWVAERQAKTAQHGLLNERYQKGAEMLGSTVLTVRLGGI